MASFVTVETTIGAFTVELYNKHAPRTCKNFEELAKRGYYNNTIFHRVIRGFMIQGGDPTGTGTYRSLFLYTLKKMFTFFYSTSKSLSLSL
jgi:cyclophilin family peptidyl-prolyl cis-trans isomerase